MQPRRIRKSATTVGFAVAVWLGAFAAAAQSSADSAVEECRRVSSPLARLDCYDRSFPPFGAASGEAAARPQPKAAPPQPARAAPQPEARAAPQPEAHAVGARQRRADAGSEPAPTLASARIVELQTPSLTTTVFVAADGRVFVRDKATSVIRWPAAPFDVSIETSRFGSSTYLIHPATGERVRVAIRD